MKKLKTLFIKDHSSGLVTDIPSLNSEWVFSGEGAATIKIDGSSVLLKNGIFYRRMDRKLNKKYSIQKKKNPNLSITEEMFKSPQNGWVPAEEKPDLNTGHWPGWVPISRDNPSDKWHFEAIDSAQNLTDGTYELIGPSLMTNIYGLDSHQLVKHGEFVVDVDRTFDGIKKFLEENYIEGLVFHRGNENDDMFKIRRKDFNIVWNPKSDPRTYPNWNEDVEPAEIDPR